MSNIAKTPRITNNTKILCFDLETNGLHGQAFAIGAVVLDFSGNVHDQFMARMPVKGETDPWVVKHVLPSIIDMPITHRSYKALRQAFWEWYIPAKQASDYVLVDNGYPIEYRFLLDCQQDDMEARYWDHPFPFIDLSSLILPFGSEFSKKQLAASVIDQCGPFRPHHPLDDARLSVLMAFTALKQKTVL